MDPLQKRREENIAGYVIGMWHLEDLMRAADLDMRKVEKQLIAPMEADEDTRIGMRDWYASIITSMREQGIERYGHLSEVEEVMTELEFLHRTLTEVLDDQEYDALVAKAEPGIRAVQQHAGGDPAGVVESCFTAVYGVMVLRAQNKEIGEETLRSEEHIRNLLEALSKHYRQMRRLPGVSMN
ncbi:MAG: DUF4924 family protein [Flavobacteriales bacterium]|nr:DUF4924 family protein [Flavobacteriales bacterium]